MEAYKEKTAKEEVKAEYFSNKKKIFVHTAGNSDITITRTAVHNLIFDMDRSYETAGLLLGRSVNGTTNFDTYVPDPAIMRRHRVFVELNNKRESLALADYARAGFNAVIFVHLHPNSGSAAITPSSMDKTLNRTDKRKAIEFSGPISKEAGFVSTYEGVLSSAKWSSPSIFRLSIFDVLSGAERTESFQVQDSEGTAADAKFNISRLLRRLGRVPEDLKHELDESFKGTLTYITNEIANNSLNQKDIADIVNRTIISNMDLPRTVKGRIHASEGPIAGSYTLVINNPPGISAWLYKDRLDKAEKNIFAAVDAMFNHN